MFGFEKFDNITKLKIEVNSLDKRWSKYKIDHSELNKKSMGRVYTLVEKYERTAMTISKIFFGAIAVLLTLGLGLLSENVRNLFTGKEVKRFYLIESQVKAYQRSNEKLKDKQGTKKPISPIIFPQKQPTSLKANIENEKLLETTPKQVGNNFLHVPYVAQQFGLQREIKKFFLFLSRGNQKICMTSKK